MPAPSTGMNGCSGDYLIRISGTVQGVGFRPFVARLANQHAMRGWVRNDGRGVTIRLCHSRESVMRFAHALQGELPPAARIDRLDIAACGEEAEEDPHPPEAGFIILESPDEAAAPVASVTPDLALCEDCRRELMDPADRRHRYPFINCTNCGPRYSIINALPYDRERTTMARFTMCPDCAAEYADPLDRRYHAQPNACPDCGPAISVLDAGGRTLAAGEAALGLVVEKLLQGGIAAIKGLGGFHLFVDAGNPEAVAALRRRKRRDRKPLAVMFPSLRDIGTHARVDEDSRKLLQSPAAPIVLLKRLQSSTLAPSIAPGNPWIGALLPYTPLHVLLMERCGRPMVATSANLSEEPLCTDNDEAVRRLRGIADLFLVHDRPIARPVDDSVQRLCANGPILLRRARGYAPEPLLLPEGLEAGEPVLALGGHLKNTVALAVGNKVILSPHIGDLSNVPATEAFRTTVSLLTGLYGGKVAAMACDRHPDYTSTRYALESGRPVVRVQHHLAHILACLLEHNGGPERVLGVCWDGTGYGDDGTIWGGEFILVDRKARTAQRVARLRTFRLPGGEEAVRKTGRSAFGALVAAGLEDEPACRESLERVLDGGAARRLVMKTALQRKLNAPVTSSAGRLFDAVAALLGLAPENTFEGRGGMSVEFAAGRAPDEAESLPWNLNPPALPGLPMEIDWSPALLQICQGMHEKLDTARLAMRFHRTLAEMISAAAGEVGVEAVVLTGGCFQNAILTDLAHDRLTRSGHKVLLHRRLSPNDNSIAAGQILAKLWNLTQTTPIQTS